MYSKVFPKSRASTPGQVLNMLADDIDRIVEESALKLLQISFPPVRYFLLTDVMGKDVDDLLVQRAVRECESYPPRLKLLQTLRSDGTWPIPKLRKATEDAGPGPPYGWTYITMLRNLNFLSDNLTSRDEGYVEAALDRLLTWQTEEGYLPGPWNMPFALPQYNGFALRAFLHFGMEKDPRVQKLIRWLLSVQRPDGGWIVPYLEDMKQLPDFKYLRQSDFVDLVNRGKVREYDPAQFYDVPSCQWTTMMVVRGLCGSYKLSGTKAAVRGAEFFLNRFFKKNYHTLFYYSEKNWTRLKYPTYFGSGLCALDILTWMGFGADDKRMERPIRWLLGARATDGFWNQSERPHPDKDQWITEIALSILNRYSESLKGVPFGREAQLKGLRPVWPGFPSAARR